MMKRTWLAFAVAIGSASLAVALSDEPAGESQKSPAAGALNVAPAAARLSVAEARRHAALLHTALHSSLQAVHHQYYRENEGLPIPAAVLKDVFAELEEEQQVKLRWLAVEGQAMNSDHKPKGAFEEAAVKALKSVKRGFEQSENGVYRRAGAITLTNHCLKGHMPDRKSTNDRTAGLIIAIPVSED